MQEIQNNKNPIEHDDHVDLRELFYILSKEKWIIVSVTAFLSIFGVIYSLSLPNLYESRALLSPTNSSDAISGALRNYSGIASLAGVNLPVSNESSNSDRAIAKLPSLSFFESDILPNIFLPDLMALKSWNSKSNTLIYDEKIYISNSNAWVGEYLTSEKTLPSAQQSYSKFKNLLTVNKDLKTGFIRISIKHQSPYISKKWVELLVNQINSFYREKDKIQSEKAIIYLNQKISTTNLSQVKDSISELIQEETQKLTLIEANEFYVFEYIDSPAVMEKKSDPKRAIICIMFALMGGVISLLIVLVKHYIFNKRTNL